MSWNAILKMLSAIGKWSGRLTALLLFLFWGAFFVEHLSEWFLRAGGRFPTAWVWVQQLFHFAMLVGLGMMVKWDKLGSAVMLAGTVAFFAGIGVGEFPWIALINLVPVGCFGVYWLSEWRPRTGIAGAQGFRRPQKANLTAIGVAFTAFVLLFGNEMFGNPPWMTPALAVSPAITGSWQARAEAWPGPTEIDILLTVSSDGTVSGKIGGAALAGARLTGNRTWLGRLLNWRTDYIIRGEISGTVGATPLTNGDRFTAPINLEGPELAGSIFTSGRDAGGKRVGSRPLVSRLRLKKM